MPFLQELSAFFSRFNRESVKEGFKAIKGDQLEAFIYDATVLEYLVGQDDECNVLTVGSWYAMTGKLMIELRYACEQILLSAKTSKVGREIFQFCII